MTALIALIVASYNGVSIPALAWVLWAAWAAVWAVCTWIKGAMSK